MDYEAMGHLESACQVFLRQGLTADLHTNITDIGVTVMDQTLAKSDGALLPKTKDDSRTHSYTITTQQEVSLEYELMFEDPILNNMEIRIKNLVSNQWEFFLDLLVNQDGTYFANVTMIELFENQEDYASYFDEFGDQNVVGVSNVNTNETKNVSPAQPASSWGTYGLIIVFVAAAIAVLLSLFTLCSIMRVKRRQNDSERNQSTSAGCSSAAKQTVSVTSIERNESDAKELGVYISEESEDTVSARCDEDLPDELSTVSSRVPSMPSMGKIQPIYSEDKLHDPQMLTSFRRKEVDVAAKFQPTLSKYHDPSNGGDLASIADSCPDTSTESHFRVDFIPLFGSRKQDTERRETENQIERLKRQRQAIEQRIKVKCNKLSKLSTSGGDSGGSRLRGHNGSSRRGIEWIESVERTLGLDGRDSLSAMTGNLFNEDVQENLDLNVTVDDGGIHREQIARTP
jgi:hypothetical protein